MHSAGRKQIAGQPPLKRAAKGTLPASLFVESRPTGGVPYEVHPAPIRTLLLRFRTPGERENRIFLPVSAEN